MNFAKFLRAPILKNICERLLLEIADAGLKACNFIKKTLHKCFRMKFPKFLRSPILKNICELLLLEVAELVANWIRSAK